MGLREALAAGLVALPFGLGLAAASDGSPGQVLRFTDPEIVESSGLVARDGLLHTVNDSGDEARVFTVDRQGRTVGVSRWSAPSGAPVDAEALAPGPPGRVWVGDIGDNPAERPSVSVTSVAVGRGDRVGDAPTYELTYPDGPVDAEALLAHPRTGRLYVVSKGVLGSRVYAAPSRLRSGSSNRLRPVGQVMPLVTDGAFLGDGRHVVLRDYGQARVYTFPALEPVGEVPLPPQEQGEGIAVDDGGGLLVSSEGVRAPVLSVDLPPRVAEAVDVARSSAGPSAGPSPSSPSSPSSSASPEDAEPAPVARSPWWWLAGGVVLVTMVAVLLRSLRPR